MDADKLAGLLPQHAPFLNFEGIPKGMRLHENSDLCGLLKVASLMKTPSRFGISADHDILYLAEPDELVELTPADAEYLSRCGVHYDEEIECLAMFC